MEPHDIFGSNPTHLGMGIIVFRLLLAALLAAVIGFEREVHNRTAGLRTHMLISIAACLFTIISVEMYHELREIQAELVQLDPLRVIQAVTAGVAFLAAGAIMRTGGSDIKGLTTGAAMWMAGAIGVVTGAGYYLVAALAAVMVFAVVYLIGLLERHVLK